MQETKVPTHAFGVDLNDLLEGVITFEVVEAFGERQLIRHWTHEFEGVREGDSPFCLDQDGRLVQVRTDSCQEADDHRAELDSGQPMATFEIAFFSTPEKAHAFFVEQTHLFLDEVDREAALYNNPLD